MVYRKGHYFLRNQTLIAIQSDSNCCSIRLYFITNQTLIQDETDFNSPTYKDMRQFLRPFARFVQKSSSCPNKVGK